MCRRSGPPIRAEAEHEERRRTESEKRERRKGDDAPVLAVGDVAGEQRDADIRQRLGKADQA